MSEVVGVSATGEAGMSNDVDAGEYADPENCCLAAILSKVGMATSVCLTGKGVR